MSERPSGRLRGMVLATQFLTRLPTPRVDDFRPDDLSRSAVWFPAVGLIVGACVAGATALGPALGAPWVGAALGLATWCLVTGALHLDGLGDLADALGAAHARPERLAEVLKDPHVGTFAVVTLVVQLLLKLVLLHALTDRPEALVLVPFVAAVARLGPLHWCRAVPPLFEGSGERFAWHVPGAAVPLWLLALVAAALCAGWSLALPPWVLAAVAVTPLALAGWARFLRRRLGGQTGDALGAGVEAVETTGLLLCALALATAS